MSQPSSPATTDSPNQERRLLVRLTGALGAFAGMILAGCGITIGGSGARGPQDMAYRRRAAQHLYQRNPAHVYHGQLPPMLRLQAAEALAMSAARRQDAAAASQWQAHAWQAVPAPTDIKAQTLENTARSLIPLRIALAGCQPGQAAPDVGAARQALAHGYDIRQLRRQYQSGWDRPLMLTAEQAAMASDCATLAREYQQLLTAPQPASAQ